MKTKELISVAISVSINCQPCLDYHIKKARELEIDDADIAETIRMVRDMRFKVAGRLLDYAAKVLKTEIGSGCGPKIGEELQCC
jgi:AhpD family alkylhydroperoxidase